MAATGVVSQSQSTCYSLQIQTGISAPRNGLNMLINTLISG